MADGNFPAKTALDPVGRQYAWVPPFLVDMLGLYVNRDGCRTPMQWNASPNAGFCGENITPWLPVNGDRHVANVQDQLGDDESLLNLYRALLRLRRDTPTLQSGALELITDPVMDKNILAYKRRAKGQTLLIALNFGKHPAKFKHPKDYRKILFSLGISQSTNFPISHLPPYAGIILERE
jgi:glycosidase